MSICQMILFKMGINLGYMDIDTNNLVDGQEQLKNTGCSIKKCKFGLLQTVLTICISQIHTRTYSYTRIFAKEIYWATPQ